ncbi:hypothetical protein [Amycolatopsis saalfeldensis]|uniref:Uncharacterized protein n=1 Tax=Amycolatopsis saalfeldensis TaxID=394193 RepID=A0A1H8Y2U5_9PSEU|nr:hypothetical protein [Amycolatopsis saalfeldensis]SEP46382.1 hypothetical protein SAMN04489732_110246 [Amycolatopsis saalfeldensis]
MSEQDGDPTADFLAEVRADETPWRTDRPAGEPAPEQPEQPEKWTRSVGRAVGQAAPYVQAALFAGWIASSFAGSGDSQNLGGSGGQSG